MSFTLPAMVPALLGTQWTDADAASVLCFSSVCYFGVGLVLCGGSLL